MNKDIIYIDVEDDITAIVGKIKSSKEKIVALVPPSRVGVLQSAVSMRLLKRAGEQAGKRVVLISNNQSLQALAAAAQMPVAKNLQSKPELADVPVMKMDGDDIIDGELLSVGELDDSTKIDSAKDIAVDSVIAGSGAKMDSRRGVKKNSKAKVPNFSNFRKRLVWIGSGVVLLVAFLVWAIWFAPRATVVITAKTTSSTVDRNVTLALGGETDVENAVVRAVKQETKSDLAVEFAATGKKRVGDKASGTMKLTRTSVSSNPLTIPAGTSFSAGSFTFVSTENATLAGTGIGPGGIVQDDATVRVQAASIGEEYNLSSRNYQSSVGGFSAQGSAMAGGASREIIVVSEEDVQKASVALEEKKLDDLKNKLTESFGASSFVIGDSFSEQRSAPSSSVAVDGEASGAVTLKTTVTASMLAVEKQQMTDFLRGSIDREIKGKQAQKIYSDGADDVKFAQFSASGDSPRVRITANGTIGPNIDEAKVKEQSRGKRYGDIQTSLESISGINDVDVQFWPFWVRVVPDSADRITVEFKLEDA